MGTIFILAGSLMGFVIAILSVGFGQVSLLAGLAIWIMSGPFSALLSGWSCLPVAPCTAAPPDATSPELSAAEAVPLRPLRAGTGPARASAAVPVLTDLPEILVGA